MTGLTDPVCRLESRFPPRSPAFRAGTSSAAGRRELVNPVCTPTPIEAAAIREAFFAGTQLWSGCDWDTDPSGGRPNLNGVSAAEASARAAAAATGVETRRWALAANWLAAVEEDVEAARDAGLRAVAIAADGSVWTAVAFARIAVETATPYDRGEIWRPLLRELERLRDRVESAGASA